LGINEEIVRGIRKRNRVVLAFKIVDTMTAEWASSPKV